MRLVVADTSPLVYLLLIDEIDVLPQLFGVVLLPEAVLAEMLNPRAPQAVLAWASQLPRWVEVKAAANTPADEGLSSLGAGERAAISLALSLHADLVLIDERKGTNAALERGLEVAGTLGILRRAAQRGLLDLASAFDRLKTTNFRYRQEMLDRILRETNQN